ncbi:MAG: hypothetical protein O2936_13855, partial [Proteobacteria bacterium]|nr:hypothetical protein [Pseudomonadota bacterium]
MKASQLWVKPLVIFRAVASSMLLSLLSLGAVGSTFLPCNDYCVQTEDRMLYRFALRSEAETFPFFQDMTYVLPERPFGAVGGAFDFELNGEFITYATTDDDGNVQSDQY